MANLITADGIETDTLLDTVNSLKASFTTIYGPDVNLGDETPDGQLINDFAEMIQDELDFNVQVYTSMDPDQAFGVTLDMRVAFNGIKRQAGSFSTTDVTIVTSQAVSLIGLDGANPVLDGIPEGAFIVADAAGNQWVLINSYDIGSAGSTILTFQAVEIGPVITTANTLTIPVTVLAGVTSVNNPSSQLSTGAAAETDAALKIRRRQSTAINSTGFYAAMIAALLNVPGVTTAQVYENETGATGIPENAFLPGHSIWVVVGGTGADADIAAAIYSKRSAGCGLFGTQTYVIVRLNGPDFTVKWDEILAEDLYVKFVLDAIFPANIVTTGDTHTGTKIIDGIPDTTGMLAGHLIRGVGIPDETIIDTVDSLHQVTTTINSTASATVAIEVVPINIPDLKAAMAAQFTAAVFETINIGQITTLIQSINMNALPTSVQVSDDGVIYANLIAPTTAQYQFTLAAGNIHIL